MHLRRPARLTAAAVLILSATACGASSGSGGPPVAEKPTFPAGTTMARLAEAGTVKIGTKFDQPLFGLKGLDGKPAGFDVEIGKIIAAKLGIAADKVEFVETPSKVREDVIQQKAVDLVVATYTINADRRQKVTFAGPYYIAGQDLMVRSDNTAVLGPDSLRPTGSRVCSVTGSTPAKNIATYVDQDKLTLFDVYSKCADALRTGQVDVVTTDNVILTGLVENGGGAFKLINKKFTEEPYGIGITKGDVAMCDFINQTLKAAEADGSYAEAWKKTLSKVSPDVPALPAADACS